MGSRWALVGWQPAARGLVRLPCRCRARAHHPALRPAGIKRSQLKHTADASASEKQAMELQHADGSTVAVQVQGCDRHGDGSRCAGGRRAGWLLGAERQRCSGHDCHGVPHPPACPATSHPRWALRVTVASVQPAAARPSLLEVLEGRGGHRHHSAGDSESDDEDVVAAEDLR